MKKVFCSLVLCLVALPAFPAEQPSWVRRSDENARLLLRVQAKFEPEAAGRLGVEGVDDQIYDLKPNFAERHRKATEEAIRELQKRLATENDPRVRQDLEILIHAGELEVKESALSEKLELPSFDVCRQVFQGVRALLDDQVAAERRPAALVRLRRYAGMEAGYTPFAALAEARTRERLGQPALSAPFRGAIEKSLSDSPLLLQGIEPLFRTYGVKDYEEPLARIREQAARYESFVRKEVLPRARTDFRLPGELYALSLAQYGIDMPPADLAQRAHGAFTEIQNQMREIAARIAKERSLPSSDYRDVIRSLKKEQLTGDAILAHYRRRLAQIEEIVRRENLVSLPDRPARIRLASEAESAALPVPHMEPPRLIGNTGESGSFVLPLNVPDNSGKMRSFDDFTFDAASWTLTAHEARPGHEMQFASMMENGVSIARAVFAFNSTNVEGWGLYAEAILKPFMPPEGQLICLQHRLLRAARAFLDPELQMGRVTPDEAKRILMEDCVFSDPMATQEVERYTFRMPGQAGSYFYGYTRLMQLRNDVQKRLGAKFSQRQFHDFILSQGLLPPELLRKAVMEKFAGTAGGA